jgi:fumarate hydratase, class I
MSVLGGRKVKPGAVDSSGDNVHRSAPMLWQKKIAEEGLLEGV